MQQRSRQLVAAALFCTLIWALVACGPGESPPSDAAETGPVRIGFVNHLTGDAAAYGQSLKKGTEVAVREINDAGGIGGRMLEVVYLDDWGGDADGPAQVRRLLSEERVPVIMGSGFSSRTISLARVTGEAGVVQIASIGTAPGLKDLGEHFFAMMPSDPAQGGAWADLARSRGITEAALLYIDNDYGVGVKNVFSARFQALGGRITAMRGFAPGRTDLREELVSLRAVDPAWVFLVSHAKEGALVLRQAQEIGLNAEWIADVAMQTREVPELAGVAAEGLIALSLGATEHDRYLQFAAAFAAMHGEEPTVWSEFAYDTTLLAAAAIAAVGTDPAAIRDWLGGVEQFAGATGPITFDADGIRVPAGAFQVMQVQGGRWRPVSH